MYSNRRGIKEKLPENGMPLRYYLSYQGGTRLKFIGVNGFIKENL